MSNPKRRRAELAVIEAAVDWHRWFQHDLAWDMSGRLRAAEALHFAVKEMEAIPLKVPTRAITGSTDTSADAAASLPDISGVALKVFDEIYLGGGLTTDQVEVKLNRTHQSVSARVNQLMNAGWLVDSGLRRPTRSNRMAIVWAPSNLAIRRVTGFQGGTT